MLRAEEGKVNGAVPLATTENETFWPCATIWLWGWALIAVGKMNVNAATARNSKHYSAFLCPGS